MRTFSYITVGKLLQRLRQEGLSISRLTFYKLENEGVFQSKKTAGKWRVYTPDEAEIIINLIKENYGLSTSK